MFKQFRGHLFWKLFLTYLLVMAVFAVVLVSVNWFTIVSAFQRHMDDFNGTSMGYMMGGSHMDEHMSIRTIIVPIRQASFEALILALLTAAGIALFASGWISYQFVAPVHTMKKASKRIADGLYSERIQLPDKVAEKQLDEFGQLALQFNQMAAGLEKTEAMRRQLIADVAHELRTPLTTIKGYTEGLIDGVLPADPETYEQIHREADRLQHLVADLQELSYVEGGKMELEFFPIQPEYLLNTLSDRLSRQFADKGVEFEMNCQPDLPDIKADEYRIGQVLVNLAVNALQYTPAGGKVGVEVTQKGEEILFSVSDSGIGIPEEHIPYLFTRFYRVDKSRSRAGGGSGIGLTIAQRLVEAHSGRIWAESPGKNQGSTFYFTLPLSKQ